MYDVLLSFIEGLALIFSPCILPVLPLVLSTSIDGGRKRPFGIITGFIIAFSAFVLLSRKLVEALHINPDSIRYASLALLMVLGFILLFDGLSEKFSSFTQRVANFGNKVGAGTEGGYFSGVLIGSLIGLVWTPCAGPILAAVLVQVIRQQTDLQSVLVTIAFALGAGIPMFIISLTGRSLMKRAGFLLQHTAAIRKVFAVLIILSAVYLGFGDQIQQYLKSPDPTSTAQNSAVSDPVLTAQPAALEKGLANPYPAPSFVGIQTWLNSNPLVMSELKGKVVLVDFWTYSCINCVRTLPYITAWDKRYRDKGLVIIGVHSPEFQFERNTDNIKAALVQHDIKYPVAVDNELSTWVSFQNKYWPAHYLIDKNGQVVYTHFGEGDYDVTENNIRYLLGLNGKSDAQDGPVSAPTTIGQTNETYLGSSRAENYSGKPTLHMGVDTYQTEVALAQHHWSLGNKWKVKGEKIISENNDATLTLNFISKKVFLVVGTESQKHVKVTLNGKPLGSSAGKDIQNDMLAVKGHNLYELVNQPESANGLLQLKFEPGVEAYAFTFGN